MTGIISCSRPATHGKRMISIKVSGSPPRADHLDRNRQNALLRASRRPEVAKARGRRRPTRWKSPWPGCCIGLVRSSQMPGWVAMMPPIAGSWLYIDQFPELRAHFPQPPCVFCAGDSSPRRYPGTSLPASFRKRSCSGCWLLNISRMVRVLRVMTAPIFSRFRRMVLTWAWAKAVRLR